MMACMQVWIESVIACATYRAVNLAKVLGFYLFVKPMSMSLFSFPVETFA